MEGKVVEVQAPHFAGCLWILQFDLICQAYKAHTGFALFNVGFVFTLSNTILFGRLLPDAHMGLDSAKAAGINITLVGDWVTQPDRSLRTPVRIVG